MQPVHPLGPGCFGFNACEVIKLSRTPQTFRHFSSSFATDRTSGKTGAPAYRVKIGGQARLE